MFVSNCVGIYEWWLSIKVGTIDMCWPTMYSSDIDACYLSRQNCLFETYLNSSITLKISHFETFGIYRSSTDTQNLKNLLFLRIFPTVNPWTLVFFFLNSKPFFLYQLSKFNSFFDRIVQEKITNRTSLYMYIIFKCDRLKP